MQGREHGKEQGRGHKRGGQAAPPMRTPAQLLMGVPHTHQHLVGCIARRAHQPLLLHVLHRALHLRGEAIQGKGGWAGGLEGRWLWGQVSKGSGTRAVPHRTFCRYASRACL